MNINSFEQEVDAKILKRGQEYFAGGLVDSISETSDGKYEAVVSGTEDYSIEVTLSENGDITDFSCDCPYDLGAICKHEVAAFLAIRKLRAKPTAKKPNKTKGVKATLKDLLDAQTKETLAELLYSIAESDRVLRQELLLRFSKNNDELELSRNLIKEHIRRFTKRGYIEYGDTKKALKGAWEVTDRAESLVDSDCVRAVKLCIIVLKEMLDVINYADDSNGEIGSVIASCLEIIGDAVLAGKTTLSKYNRDELFDLILDESRDKKYRGWHTYHISFYECLIPLAGDPALYKKLWDELNSQRSGLSERNDYYGESIAELQLSLLSQWESEDKCREFLLSNLQYHSFRRQAIGEAMDAADYETVLGYAQAGLEQAEQTKSPGYAREWRAALFDAYEAMNDTAKMRELSEYFVKHERDGITYYNTLKNTTPANQWANALQELFTYFEAQPSVAHTYTDILLVEKEYDRLMKICRANSSRIIAFAPVFPKSYKSEVILLYQDFILKEAAHASDRSRYKDVCSILIEFGKVCGKQLMLELAQQIRLEHPKQPAFLDELSKVR